MNSVSYKVAELFILYILIPISLVLDTSIWIKLILGVLGFIYVIYILLRVQNNTFKISKTLNWSAFWERTSLTLFAIIMVTIPFVFFTQKDLLFEVLLNNFKLWILILFVYSVFSVYPQELIFRTFFFQRYESLFKDRRLLIFVNAIVFSLAHLFFRNALVMVITFIGGLLFGLTFFKTRSTLLVSIEHAIYGSWLFTVGMGNMLGFPASDF